MAALEWVHCAFDPKDVFNTTFVSHPGGRTGASGVARRPRGASAEAPLAGRYFRGNQLRNVPCEGSAGICVTACEHGWERTFGQYGCVVHVTKKTARMGTAVRYRRHRARDAPTSPAALRCPLVSREGSGGTPSPPPALQPCDFGRLKSTLRLSLLAKTND